MQLRNIILYCAVLFTSFSALLPQSAVLNGHLYGANGKPMKAAHISVYAFGNDSADRVVQVQSSGGFSIEIPKKGLYRLIFSGVDHQALSLPLYVQSALREELDINLASVQLPKSIDSVLLLSSFNNYSISSGIRMQLKKGDYTATMKASGSEQRYKIAVFGDKRDAQRACITNGTHGDSYEFSTDGSYITVSSAKDKEVHMDLSALPQTSVTPRMSFKNPLLQKVANIYYEMTNFNRVYQDSMYFAAQRHQAKGGDKAGFDIQGFNASQRISEKADTLAERIRVEQDEEAKQMLNIFYLSIPAESRIGMIMERSLKVIPPSSPLWSIDMQLLYTALNARQRETKEQYVNDILSMNECANVVAAVAYNELVQANVSGDKSRAKEMYKILSEKYPSHKFSQAAKFYFKPDRKIQEGNTLFSFTLTTDKGRSITSETLKGKYTLIDVWGDNCGMCLNTMNTLDKTLSKFKQQSFQCMVVALGKVPAEFATTKTKSTWIAGGLDKERDKATIENFEYVGHPWRILVSPEGTILACSADLNDEHIAATLEAKVGK